MNRRFRSAAVAACLTAAGALPCAALAQSGPPPATDDGPPPAGQTYNVPPPPGYQGGPDAAPAARAEDDRYAYEAEQWAARNCVAQRANDTAAGAVIGGILGAIIGGGLAGRYDRGAGVVTGGALGAIAGGAIGRSNAEQNPACPPGYGLAPGAQPFYPGAVFAEGVYVAPGWYDPWLWYGGHWIYRPYPYHRYWGHTHYR